MRRARFAGAGVMATLLMVPSFASAQTPDLAAIQKQIDQLRQQLQALQEQLAQVAAQPAAQPLPAQTPAVDQPRAAVPAAAPQQPPAEPTATVPPGAEGAGGPSGSLPVYGAGAASSKVFNPDIAVIGNFLGAAGHNSVNPSPALELPEAEASFQAVVDPYARADFFMSFGEEGVDLEEGYITFPALPGGLLVKAGKVRAAFGKVNMMHSHVSPWTDRPLVTDNLLNGEAGISDAGFSVARLIPNPWLFLEGTGQVFRGDSGDLFTSSTRSDLSYVGHLRGYQDITENTNLDLGASYAHGHNASGVVDGIDVGRFTTRLAGVDATLRWRPLQRSIYNSFVGRAEVVWSARQQPEGEQRSTGFYVSGDYQLARRWFAGARYDRSGRADSATTDSGQSLLVTYWPSEFSQVRTQYRRTRYAETETANEILFQLLFSIGAHGAHPF